MYPFCSFEDDFPEMNEPECGTQLEIQITGVNFQQMQKVVILDLDGVPNNQTNNNTDGGNNNTGDGNETIPTDGNETNNGNDTNTNNTNTNDTNTNDTNTNDTNTNDTDTDIPTDGSRRVLQDTTNTTNTTDPDPTPNTTTKLYKMCMYKIILSDDVKQKILQRNNAGTLTFYSDENNQQRMYIFEDGYDDIEFVRAGVNSTVEFESNS